MRLILLSIAAAVFLATAGPAWADPGKDESGRGRGRGDEDQKEYSKRLEERRREDRKRSEERYRDDEKRAREAERESREVYLAQRDRGVESYSRGYRGYSPLAPYPARLSPQPDRYDGYRARSAYPYGDVGDWLGYGQDGYGGRRPPDLGESYYGPGRVAPYQEVVPYRTGGYDYDGYPNPSQGFDRADPYPYAPPTGGQITALADQLVAQADAFLQAFLPKMGVVPESGRFLADATVLRDSAIRLREVALRRAPPADLAAEFLNVEASWQRLEARMARVSKGRLGPNIAEALQMGDTIEQIRQLMPY